MKKQVNIYFDWKQWGEDSQQELKKQLKKIGVTMKEIKRGDDQYEYTLERE